MTDNGLLLAIAMVIATAMTLSQFPVMALIKHRTFNVRWVIQSVFEWPVAIVVTWGILYIAYSLYFNSPP